MSEADRTIERIDEFFRMDELLTEEEKLAEGLKYGVSHGMLTEDEATECLRAFHLAYINTPQ